MEIKEHYLNYFWETYLSARWGLVFDSGTNGMMKTELLIFFVYAPGTPDACLVDFADMSLEVMTWDCSYDYSCNFTVLCSFSAMFFYCFQYASPELFL